MNRTSATSARDFVAALDRGDGPTAISVARAMVSEGTKLGDQWRAIARFAATRAEWSLAIDCIRLFAANAPGDPARQLAVADVLAQAGRLCEAIVLIEPLTRTLPDDPRPFHFLGTAHAELGDAETAIAFLRTVVARAPSGMSWLTLAGAKRFGANDPDLSALIAAEAGSHGGSAAQRAPLLYALGKAWDDLGEHDAAFATFTEGAALTRQARPYDAVADRDAANRIVAQVRTLTPRVPDPEPDRAIFVTGIPRSGTTLVEQILTSHSAVADGGELNILRLAAEHPGAGAAGQMIRRHYEHLLAERFGTEGRIVDKSLNTSRLVGALVSAMPAAPIVWLRRDPLDTAWSCFRTFFAQGVPWSWSLADIAAHFRIEDALFAHWTAVLGERILVVDYARLVTEPAAQIARITAHCGLALEPGQLRPQDTMRAVTTSSVAQVREPINARAIDAAGPYRRHLQPFVDAYGYPG